MATISPPQPPSTSQRPPRRPSGGWIAAIAVLVLALVAIPIALMLNNGDEPATTTTGAPTTTVPGTETTVPPTTVPPVTAPADASLYFLADYVEAPIVPGPHLVATHGVASVADPASAEDMVRGAVSALLSGPSGETSAAIAGVASAIPPGTELLDATLDAATGTVWLDFNAVFESGGGTFSMGARLAQVVYTATAVEGVEDVLFLIDGQVVEVFSSEGLILDGPQGRDAYVDLLPPIFVESPLAGQTVGSPIIITGIANVFEASFMYAIEDASGNRLVEAPAMASCGTGCWGDFEISQGYALPEAQDGAIVVWVNSARDGLPETIVRIPVTLRAAEGETAFVLDMYSAVPGSPGLFGTYVTEPSVMVSGTTNVGTTLTVNGGTVPVDGNGFFEVEIPLEPGPNDVTFVVTSADGSLRRSGVVTYLTDASVELGYASLVVFDADGQLTTDIGEGGPWPMLVDVDGAEWFTGDAANEAARADGIIGADETVPNDYYIRNSDTTVVQRPVNADAAIILQTSAEGPVTTVAASMEEWFSLFKPDGTPWNPETDDSFPDWSAPHFGYLGAGMFGAPYWFTIDADGEILQIVQQYIP